MGKVNVGLFRHQVEFINSTTTNTGLIGGFGSGKTHAGITKSICQLIANRVNIAYYLPTYALIKDVGIPNFESLLTQFGIAFKTNKVDKDITTQYGKIMLRSFDRPETIVAYEVGYSVIDEADTVPKEKMRVIYRQAHGRNRQVLPNNATPKPDFVSTPHGHKFLYEFFVTKSTPDRYMIRAKTDDNLFLHASYIEGMRTGYTSAEMEAFRFGKFINLTTGLVYSYYNQEANNSVLQAYPKEVIHVGIDFNIGKMSAVSSVIRDGEIHCIDEVFGAYDTRDLVEQLKAKHFNNKLICYPDRSGLNRSTNSNVTDIEILKKHFTVVVKYKPSIRNRVNKVNACFENDMGLRELYVNAEKCPHLVICLESQVYDSKGKPDKHNDFDHLPDCLGYFIYTYKAKPPSRTPNYRKYGAA